MKTYLLAISIFFTVDMIWLGLVAQKFYADQIGFLMKPDINWLAAVIFYLLFVFALTVFVINPAIEKNSIVSALVMGAFFGLVSYATYDLTNLATLAKWPILVTVVDLIWGSTLGGLVSFLTVFISQKIGW